MTPIGPQRAARLFSALAASGEKVTLILPENRLCACAVAALLMVDHIKPHRGDMRLFSDLQLPATDGLGSPCRSEPQAIVERGAL